MIDPPVTTDRSNFRIIGLVIAVVVVTTLIAIAVVFVAKQAGLNIPLPSISRSTPTTPLLSLTRATELRAGPAPDTAIVTHLAAQTGVQVIGRSLDGAWLVVRLSGAADIVGWVPTDAVEGARDAARLPVIVNAADVPATTASGTQQAPDLPDLRLEAASSRNNRLVAVIVNDGPGDLPTPILVAVNDGMPIRIETKGGEPLRAKERIEATVPGEYVQLRARVTLRVQTEPANREKNTENNSWSGIVEPDQPNNIGIATAIADGADRHLIVTVRNDSPIPIRGMITLTVREALPSTNLLGRDSREVGLDPSKTIDVPFPDIRQVDLTRIAIRLSTDAIHDAVLPDDSFPR